VTHITADVSATLPTDQQKQSAACESSTAPTVDTKKNSVGIPISTLTDDARAHYNGPDLASTLLVRLGLMDPEEAERASSPPRRSRRRRLRTPKDVIRAIGDVVSEIEAGEIDPPAARARLYALQTLLVALRMTMTNDPEPALPERLQLEAVAETVAPDPHEETRHLMHLQTLTTADSADTKGA